MQEVGKLTARYTYSVEKCLDNGMDDIQAMEQGIKIANLLNKLLNNSPFNDLFSEDNHDCDNCPNAGKCSIEEFMRLHNSSEKSEKSEKHPPCSMETRIKPDPSAN